MRMPAPACTLANVVIHGRTWGGICLVKIGASVQWMCGALHARAVGPASVIQCYTVGKSRGRR